MLALLCAGEIDENPTISERFAAFGAETGWGEAYCVCALVVKVDAGGGMPPNDETDA